MAEGKKQQSQSQVGQNQHLERINQQLQAYLQAQGEYQVQLQRIQAAQQTGARDLPEPSKPAPSHELSDYLLARSLLAQYETDTGKKLQADFAPATIVPPEPVASHIKLPNRARAELHELWSAGVQEVFSKHHHQHPPSLTQPTTQPDVNTQHHSFEINPITVVFSRLPLAIRSRRFSRSMTQLSSDTIAS
jgi:hypothetical protein